jgi:hypothetical protein
MSLLQSGINALVDSDIPTIFTLCCFEGAIYYIYISQDLALNLSKSSIIQSEWSL